MRCGVHQHEMCLHFCIEVVNKYFQLKSLLKKICMCMYIAFLYVYFFCFKRLRKFLMQTHQRGDMRWCWNININFKRETWLYTTRRVQGYYNKVEGKKKAKHENVRFNHPAYNYKSSPRVFLFVLDWKYNMPKLTYFISRAHLKLFLKHIASNNNTKELYTQCKHYTIYTTHIHTPKTPKWKSLVYWTWYRIGMKTK